VEAQKWQKDLNCLAVNPIPADNNKNFKLPWDYIYRGLKNNNNNKYPRRYTARWSLRQATLRDYFAYIFVKSGSIYVTYVGIWI